jgi:hypothetical protein
MPARLAGVHPRRTRHAGCDSTFSMRCPTLLLPALSLLAACSIPEAGPPAVPRNPPPERAVTAVAADEPPISGNSNAVTQPSGVFIESVEGAEVARARATFAPVVRSVQECRPGSGGVLRVQIRSAGEQTRYTLLPGSTLGPLGGRCALEVLSTVNLADVQSRASPSNRPTGFTALIRIEW